MKVLAVDTSSSVAAVAVMDGLQLLGEYSLNHRKTHSQKLMPMVKELLDSLELKPEDIDLYAASSGPGSFTGLRIGITTVKAIAYAVGKPVASVPTLDALAFNMALSDKLICPMLDARNQQVYTAVYRWEKQAPVKLTEYMGIHIRELAELVKGKNQAAVFLGDAAELHKDLLRSELGEHFDLAPANLQLQRGASVAQAALYMAAQGMLENCFDMVPFYLRKSQAERELEKKQCTIDN